jgi:hypothetical protein
MALTTRKGNSNIDPISLNTRLRVNPTIVKGNSKSQISGNSTSITRANGQLNTNRIHQRIMAMNVFMNVISYPFTKPLPISISG